MLLPKIGRMLEMMRSAISTARMRRLDAERLIILMKPTPRDGAAIGAPVFLSENLVRKKVQFKMQRVVSSASWGGGGGARAHVSRRAPRRSRTPRPARRDAA